jgi:hypothetical protein
VHLANTAAIKQYEGLKHSGDETDAQHLAHLLRLARISHRVKRIEAPNQRKFFCEKDFAMIRGAPRCRQSVAQNGLILEWWKAALWKRPSMRDW